MFKRIAPFGLATLLVFGLGATAHGTTPGKNGLLAFQAQTDDGIQVFTMRPSGRDLRQVTHIAGNAGGPEWSPDGSRLLLILDEFEATESGCVIGFVDPDGGNLTRLLTDPAGLTPGVDVCQGDAAWFPDGQHIVVGRYDPALDQETTWRVRVDGSHWVPVAAGSPVDVNISPDGTRMSFKGGDAGALYVQHVTGGEQVRVSPAVEVAFKHDWAPNGNQLVLSDFAQPGPDQPVNIATVRPDGTGFAYITHFTDPRYRAYVGSYSPDGRWIVFRLEDRDQNALFRIRPDGTAMHRLTPWSEFRPRNTDWGSAGR